MENLRIQAATHRERRREEIKEKTQRANTLVVVFGLSALVVMGILAAVGLMLYVRFMKEPEAVFEAVPKKTIKIPPKTPEHKMNVAQHEASKPKPTFTQKLISTKPSAFALPDLPQVNLDQMLPLDPSELVTDQVSSLMGSSGIGNGMGNSLIGGGGTGTGLNFMGIQSQGSKIVLIFDISTSVVNKAEKAGLPFAKIKEETIKWIENLNPNMRFGIIQFSRAFRPYQKELIVATSGNKKAASEWLEGNWQEGSLARNLSGVISQGNDGIIEVLNYAFAQDPDVIFLLSDGSFQDNTNQTVDHELINRHLTDLQKKSTAMGGVKVNFIGFGMRKEDQESMKKIIRKNGGQIRQIE